MPIYEYECESCGKILEVMQKFSDEPLSVCTECSGKMHKLISRSSFHLKGSGWYVTDYVNKNNDKKTNNKTSSTENKTGGEKTTSDKSEKASENST
jgi:putative FmdB family regulatory protein